VPPPDRPRPRFVVGIGASAGGLEAVAELLGALPPTGMAFIVVQHLDPTHESLLSEILARKTAMPVLLAVAGEALQPNHVYVIPADAILTVRDGHIDLKRRTSGPERPSPVDALFTSLAAAYADYAIGVVLSGGDADGSAGLREIKHAGGVTFAQRPDTARFPMMPRHAIDTGCVDVVLRPSEIAAEIAHLSRSLCGDGSALESGAKGTFDIAIDGESARLRQIFQRLRAAHGVDFTHYKRTTIKRRIERRMSLRRIESLDDYGTLLDSDAGEVAALYQDFLIRVTEFFRDPDSFDALRRYVFPTLCEGRPAKQPIRIWVPGCATGEEVYSVAIALLEYLGNGAPAFRIQIFGTDVSEAALQKARAGVYHVNSLRDVSPERLERFFTKQNGDYGIAKDIRDLCLFARQDVTRDPPFSRLDLISCRNLLIYLDEVAQRRVLRTFHYALRPQGRLFFGPAESVAQSSELFEQADKRFRVFRRMPNTGAESVAGRARDPHSRVPEPDGSDGPLLIEADSLPREGDRLLLARFAPPCVLVNESLTIQQFRGQTGPYLEPAGGQPSLDLRRVVRPELLVHILPAIQETTDTGVSSRRDVRLSDGHEIEIEVVLLPGASGSRSFLVIFNDESRQAAGRPSPASALPESEKDRRLAQLQREVEGLRDYMRAAVEEHGAVQEELRSAHEEMLSANEEFQSANEELETSKEELQSTNEELTTTIDELRSRNQELAALNVELDSARLASDRARAHADIIIETVRQPLAVLDAAQRILRVNSAFLVNLEIHREQAEGRLLDEVGNERWDFQELRRRVGALLTDAQPLDDWEVPVDLPRQGRRVMSFSARKIPGDAERTELVLLALEDVTARAEAKAGLLSRIERKDHFIATLGHELRHPLTPIAHAIYLLRRNNPDPATSELLDTIDTQAQRLVRFVDELVDVARIGQGQIDLRRERVDVVAVAREAVQAVRPFIEERQQELSLSFSTAPIYVDGDPDRLGQVVTNLLENAAKYTPQAGRIAVALEQRDGDALLRVRDSGMGIAAEDLERIFEPFMRSHEALAVPSTGLGLGLSVVRRVLELHRGHVTAASGGLGMGSEFVVSLPVGARHVAAARPERAVETPMAVATTRPRRVLIVDDHEEIRKSLARLVRVWGHEVALAADAPSALSVAETFRPQCAIVDISMPGIDGIHLARSLREKFPREQLFMIALTGYAGAGVREACLKAGFDEHLVKPGEITLLENLLGRDRSEAGG
jgi:two-component system, chemotaxis family, CheB/CheR fusion protein